MRKTWSPELYGMLYHCLYSTELTVPGKLSLAIPPQVLASED